MNVMNNELLYLGCLLLLEFVLRIIPSTRNLSIIEFGYSVFIWVFPNYKTNEDGVFNSIETHQTQPFFQNVKFNNIWNFFKGLKKSKVEKN